MTNIKSIQRKVDALLKEEAKKKVFVFDAPGKTPETWNDIWGYEERKGWVKAFLNIGSITHHFDFDKIPVEMSVEPTDTLRELIDTCSDDELSDFSLFLSKHDVLPSGKALFIWVSKLARNLHNDDLETEFVITLE